MAAKAKNPNYKEGRKTKERPADYGEIVNSVGVGEMNVKEACEKMGISRSLWYKWLKEVA
jgi:transposase-like protein